MWFERQMKQVPVSITTFLLKRLNLCGQLHFVCNNELNCFNRTTKNHLIRPIAVAI